MTVKKEMNLVDFRFWGGAVETDALLTWRDLETIEQELVAFKDEWDATELNDLFWFDRDYIAEILGYMDWESLEYHRKEPYFDREDV